MAEFNIALIPGDGIGPEIVSGAVTVLDAVSKKYGHKFNYQEVYMGGCAIDKYGVPLPQETVDICKKSDSVLFRWQSAVRSGIHNRLKTDLKKDFWV